MRMETDIKTKTTAARGYGDAPDGRDFVAPVAVAKDRSAACRSPGLPDVGYEQKSALVQEGDVGIKRSGFFLKKAMSCASTMLWPFRSFAELVAEAFDSSSRNRCVRASIRRRAYTGRHNRPLSAVRSVSASTGRWHVQLPLLPATASVSAFLSAVRSKARAVPIWPGSEFPGGHFSDRPDTSAPPNSGRISTSAQPSGRFCPHAAWRWPADDAVPNARDFRVVSYPIIYIRQG